MHQETADELACIERHHPIVSLGAVKAIVLPLEGDALVVGRDQAAVGDGDTVGIAGKIAQDLLRSPRRRVSASRSSMPTARWKHSAGAALVGFGGRADAALRRMARLLGRSRRATQRTGTRCLRHHEALSAFFAFGLQWGCNRRSSGK
jgi:hypothetical protein